ncbi:Ribosomal protein S6 modification protein [Bremerella volcania]|uniref:Ribosomal protein S6 modification protein n=1 Tax=Bremerella volcania TaxID=2527984 RepID=A0A518CAK4_9BACT|nr:RimK family alpha-L-glutamate ligase [Bremerella volcania]QDU76262.1 Ribosomal protein S6 modification protein [Bremerella volcania]
MDANARLPRIGVLANEDSWYFQDLQRAAIGKAQVQRLEFSALQSRIGGRESISADAVLSDNFDAVIVRSMPPGSLEQVVFRMDALAGLERQGVLIINPPKSMELAIDKYLSLSKLSAAGYRVPQTHVCQTWQDAMDAFEELGPSVVVKPIFGGEGRGIMRVEDADLAHRVFKTLQQMDQIIYLQKFVPHPGYDLRVLVLGEMTWGMRRTSADSWRTNLSRGASASAESIPDEVAQVALDAVKTLDLSIAGLDFLPDGVGGWYLLEANAVPGWKGLAKACDVDIAAKLIDYVIARVTS